jgi:hypothetical protein
MSRVCNVSASYGPVGSGIAWLPPSLSSSARISVGEGRDVAEAVHHELLHAVRHLDDIDVMSIPTVITASIARPKRGHHR